MTHDSIHLKLFLLLLLFDENIRYMVSDIDMIHDNLIIIDK